MATATATGLLHIQLLGGFKVAVAGRVLPPATWRRKRAAALIKVLALEPSHRLHREQILEALWPELDPEAADNNLRFTLYEARKRLSEVGAERNAFLVREGESLILGPAEVLAVDVDAFERAAAASWRSEDSSVTAAALERYTGDLLPDDPYEEWTESRRATLRAAYLALLRRLGDLHLKRGQGTAAVATLEQLVATEPTDEAAYVRLMKALARTGQAKRALAQYDRLVDVLERDVGAAPEEATTRLRDDIAAGRYPPPLQTLTAATSSSATNAGSQVSMPTPVDALIGREREVAEIGQLLSAVRLVTLTGPGGVGKTRLALAVAHQMAAAFPDGVFFIELSAVRDPKLVLSRIAQAVGVREGEGQSLRDKLVAYLRDRRPLLVLDNLEQVVAAAPTLAELLAGSPELKVFATSRVRLRLRGEREYPISPLALPDPAPSRRREPPLDRALASPAVRLFVERAQAAKPTFALTAANVEDVVAICHRLDGLPLALELAAAWVKLLPLAVMRARLETRRLALTGGARDLPERQQTIRTTIAWSYDLLTPEQQALFRRLAVFAGGWTLEAAEAIGIGSGELQIDVLEGLRALVDHSLVVESEQLDGEPRFGMLETIREYGLEHLAASGEDAAVRDAHAEHFLAFAERAAPELVGPAQAFWLNRLALEHENLRASLTWTVSQPGDRALRLASAMTRFWRFRSSPTEGQFWLEQVLAQDEGGVTHPRANALLGAGIMASVLGHYAQAAGRHERALALYRTLGDASGIGRALFHLGEAAVAFGNEDRAETLFVESLEVLRGLSDDVHVVFPLKNLGRIARRRRDYAQATAYLEEALAACQAAEFLWGRAEVLLYLAEVGRDEGNWARAARQFAEGLELYAEYGDALGMGSCLRGLADIAIERGQEEQGARLLRAAVALHEALGVHSAVADKSLSPAMAAAWEGGRTLTPEQAIAEGLAAAALL